MEWEKHDKWARKLDIPRKVSREVNILIDAIERRKDLPAEEKEELDRIRAEVISERDVAGSDSIMTEVVALNDGHDSARTQMSQAKLHAEVQLKYLRRKSEDHVKAWYLHHYMDFLHEMQTSDHDLEQLLTEYRQKYPQASSESTEKFLMKHRDKLPTETET